MSAYLYTWNPKAWFWVDQDDAIYRVNNGEKYDMYWSCGNTKKINVGDVFFLMRLGEEPKGIIGCGYVLGAPEILEHWDEGKAAEGKKALKTNLVFKALSETPIFSLSELQKRYPDYRWTPEAGGLTIPDAIADELFDEIQSGLKFGFSKESLQEVKLYAEGRPKTVTSKTYDRSTHARQACIEHYGHDCFVCGFNFKSKYGDVAPTYIEVHHLRPVADVGREYLINPIKDLRPVCANCHRALHRGKSRISGRPPLSIEELIESIK